MTFPFRFVYEHGLPFAIFFVLLNLITFALFHEDKRRAEKHAFRIRERELLGFAACFGGLGGILGMIVFHHKTKKPRFLILVPLFSIVQMILINLVFVYGPKAS